MYIRTNRQYENEKEIILAFKEEKLYCVSIPYSPQIHRSALFISNGMKNVE